MTSYIDVPVDQLGNETINMDDDMMSEYYNTTNINGPTDDHAMMMMEEADQESSNLIPADTTFNDDETASVSNEVVMGEYGNDGKMNENITFTSTSYTDPSIPAEVEIQHSIGVDLPDETIGDAVYEEEERAHMPPVDAVVAEKEETTNSANTGLDQTGEPEVVQKEAEQKTVAGTEHGTQDSNDEYATEGHLSENPKDGNEEVPERIEITQELVDNGTGETLIVKEEEELQPHILDQTAEEGQEGYISSTLAVVEQNVEGNADQHQSVQPNPIRITFDGQDFVLYPDEESSTFISTNQERIQAPALQVEAKVFSDPLESLFEALRIREALGDFLDEGTELCLTFHDLDMIAREDDIYIREVTLDDIQRLHSGLGYTSSMHIGVSETQRFISRYNDLANQVSLLIEQKTGNESVEEGKGEQTNEFLAVDTNVVKADGAIADSIKGEAAGELHTEEEVERKEEGEEEGDQDEEETFVTVTNDQEGDEEQYVESYEEGGGVQDELQGDEHTEQNEENEEHPRQVDLSSVQVAPAENAGPAPLSEETELEADAAEETHNEPFTEEVEGNGEVAEQEKGSGQDTATTLSGDGEELENQNEPDYEPTEDIGDEEADDENEEEEGTEELRGIEEVYEDYEEEGKEGLYDDGEEGKEVQEELYEEEVEPQVGSHGQKRQLEDELEYSTEDLNGEGVEGLDQYEDDNKRARYEEPEKDDA